MERRLRELNLAGNSLSAVPYMTVRAGEVRVEENRLKAQRKEARSRRAAQKRKATNQREGGGVDPKAPDANASGFALGPTLRPAAPASQAQAHTQTQAQAVQADGQQRPSTNKTVRFDDSHKGELCKRG